MLYCWQSNRPSLRLWYILLQTVYFVRNSTFCYKQYILLQTVHFVTNSTFFYKRYILLQTVHFVTNRTFFTNSTFCYKQYILLQTVHFVTNSTFCYKRYILLQTAIPIVSINHTKLPTIHRYTCGRCTSCRLPRLVISQTELPWTTLRLPSVHGSSRERRFDPDVPPNRRWRVRCLCLILAVYWCYFCAAVNGGCLCARLLIQ